MRSRVDRLFACVVVLGLLTAPPSALAAKAKHKTKHTKKSKKQAPEKPVVKIEEKPAETPKTLAKAEADKATVSFKLGRFEEALTGYSRAYEIFQASGLLFNIGQCHRQLGHSEKAVFFFTGYLRDNPEAANAEDVAALIEEEKQKIERAAASAPASQSSSAPIVLKEPPAQQTNAMLPMTGPGVHTQWWFWTILVAGAAVIATVIAVAVIFSPGPPAPATSLGSLDRAR